MPVVCWLEVCPDAWGPAPHILPALRVPTAHLCTPVPFQSQVKSHVSGHAWTVETSGDRLPRCLNWPALLVTIRVQIYIHKH